MIREFFKILLNEDVDKNINDIIKSSKDFGKLLKTNNIDYCIVGSIALREYNYKRYTEDFDILINRKDREKFLELKDKIFKEKSDNSRKQILIDSNVEFDFFFSGSITHKGRMVLPDPNEVSIEKNGVYYMSLFKLIEWKLYSGIYVEGRIKDLGDVQELIKLNNLPKEYLDEISDDKVKNKYFELWNDVEVLKNNLNEDNDIFYYKNKRNFLKN